VTVYAKGVEPMLNGATPSGRSLITRQLYSLCYYCEKKRGNEKTTKKKKKKKKKDRVTFNAATERGDKVTFRYPASDGRQAAAF